MAAASPSATTSLVYSFTEPVLGLLAHDASYARFRIQPPLPIDSDTMIMLPIINKAVSVTEKLLLVGFEMNILEKSSDRPKVGKHFIRRKTGAAYTS